MTTYPSEYRVERVEGGYRLVGPGIAGKAMSEDARDKLEAMADLCNLVWREAQKEQAKQ